MSLVAGTRLGPYEIQSAIGAGGMGEVYKARDTRLDRTVAIKVLPTDISGDPERRARFEREAKTIAGLNHAHICVLHDVGDHEGSMFLVMEHLAGQTLAERLEKGPLPLEQTLTIATEMAEALSAAHRQGVIHRDLKPANVMLTKGGAKLLDFGLAKLTGHGEQPAAAYALSAVPTQAATLTGQGVIVGTLQYMAPEQLEGKPPDARTDLWALGAILYEMVTGKRAFAGDSHVSLIGNIMNAEPTPLSTLQPLTPSALDRLVRQCLAKSPDDRPDTAHDVANELRWMRETSGAGAPAGVPSRPRRVLLTAPLAAVGLLTAMIGAGVMWLVRPIAPPQSVARLSMDVRPAEDVSAGPTFRAPVGSRTAMAWSPDGQALVFVGRRGGVRQLYVRRLDAGEARPLSGTEGAQALAISADGQWVAFWAAGAIRKVPIGGGPVMDLASGLAHPPKGLAWSGGGRLFFDREDGRIWAIPPRGAPTAVTALGEAEVSHALPWPLPGERAVLFTLRKRYYSWGGEEVVAHMLATGERKVLLREAADARYVPTGHLVFLRRGVLFAVSFDAERLETRGPEVPVLDSVTQSLTGGNVHNITGAGQFAIATTGTLAWVPGPVVPFFDRALVAVDRRGQVVRLPAAPVRSYGAALRLSPDGHRLVMPLYTLTERGVWVYDLSRGTLTPLTRGGEAVGPKWSPDGLRVVFGWLRDGRRSLAEQLADGSGPPRVLVAGDLNPSSFTPDGRQVAAARSEQDIVIVTLEDGQARVQPLIETPHVEGWAEFSPDGRWLAYASDVSGRYEVYVRPYPGPGATEPVSVEGGRSPAWNRNGRELFFMSLPEPAGTQRMMAVDVAPGPRIGRPRPLFDSRGDLTFDCPAGRCYDVAPDGQRFYATQLAAAPLLPAVTHLNLILNWFEELKAKVPPPR